MAGALLLLTGCDTSSQIVVNNVPAESRVAPDVESPPTAPEPAGQQANAPATETLPGEPPQAAPGQEDVTTDDTQDPPAVDSSAAPTAGPPSGSPAPKVAPTPSGKTTPAAGNRIVDKTFDDLKFDIEPDAPFSREMLTDEIEAMFGQRIRIRGYILPTFQREGITQFILVRDDQECCFGPGAALFDCIVVEMQPGKSTNFSVKPVAVEGRFTFEELIGPDEKHLAIFHLEGESVK